MSRIRAAFLSSLASILCGTSITGSPAAETEGEGSDGFIGIYADAQGTIPCASIPVGQIGTLYVVATTPTGGFTGAEFSIQITDPAGYQFIFIPPEGGNVIGDPIDRTPNDPLDQSGVNIAYPSCRTNPIVGLGSIVVVNLNGGPTELRVERRYAALNPFIGNCPLFVNCIIPSYDLACMRSCDVNETGGAIAARLGLNQSDCAPRDCAAACPGAPCASLIATSPTSYCPGEEVTIGTTATNCSNTEADMDVYVQHVLAGSFTDVPAGGSVTATRTYVVPSCDAPHRNPVVGVVARNQACTEPFGFEIARPMNCNMVCTPNQPPDCSAAAASIATLWPADGSLQSVSVVGITDPENDPVTISIPLVFTDEFTGTSRDPNCPDAFFEGPNAVRLRAERDADGDGRVYVLFAQATDPQGAECTAEVQVCVPRKPGVPCVEPPNFFDLATQCSPSTTNHGPRSPVVSMQPEGEVAIAVPVQEANDVRVEVFDVRGRLRRVVARGRFAVGEHVLRWDGKDDAGRAVAVGVYVVRIRRGGEVTNLKAVVAR